MSKYTANEAEEMADHISGTSEAFATGMLRDLARRIRQEDEENKRDPVTDPRPGDWINAGPYSFIWAGDAKTDLTGKIKEWMLWAVKPGATIIRRREVPQ